VTVLRPDALAIDPGEKGGAVMLSGTGRLVFAASWKGNQRDKLPGFALSVYLDDDGSTTTHQLPRRPSALGSALASLLVDIGWQPARLACEDVFLHRASRNFETPKKLARFGGGVMAPLEELCDTSAAYVQAQVWRAAVLRLPRNAARERAKVASLRYMPPMVPGLPGAIAALGEHDHLTDAAGIAAWRQRYEPKKRGGAR